MQTTERTLDEVLERRELKSALHASLAILDDEERELVIARYCEGRLANELAMQQGISPNTMRRRLMETLRQLRTLLIPTCEPSMEPNKQVQVLAHEIETRLATVSDDEWFGRIVVSLQPSSEGTDVTSVELVPTAPRRVTMQMRRALKSAPLPGCFVPPLR